MDFFLATFTQKESEMFKFHKRIMMSVFLLTLLGLALVLAIPSRTVLANANPAGTGQPSQSCEVSGVRPGKAISAPGSAFNPNGVAGTVYAGNQAVNSNNPKSVSQYDVACFQVSQH
jgi:hypothetical protein